MNIKFFLCRNISIEALERDGSYEDVTEETNVSPSDAAFIATKFPEPLLTSVIDEDDSSQEATRLIQRYRDIFKHVRKQSIRPQFTAMYGISSILENDQALEQLWKTAGDGNDLFSEHEWIGLEAIAKFLLEFNSLTMVVQGDRVLVSEAVPVVSRFKETSSRER